MQRFCFYILILGFSPVAHAADKWCHYSSTQGSVKLNIDFKVQPFNGNRYTYASPLWVNVKSTDMASNAVVDVVLQSTDTKLKLELLYNARNETFTWFKDKLLLREQVGTAAPRVVKYKVTVFNAGESVASVEEVSLFDFSNIDCYLD